MTSDRGELSRIFPQFALRIAVPGAHLEVPTDAQLQTLAAHAARPEAILPAAQAHFVAWLAGRTPGEIEDQRISRVHANRDLARRPGWTLDLAVIVDGEPVGIQSLSGFERWPRRRIVGTTSWLIEPHQRQGLGTRCRAAVLGLAFDHLGAEAAKSWALQDNLASIAVSSRLGYDVVDRHVVTENGREYVELVYELTLERWLGSPVRARYPAVITDAAGFVGVLAR